MGGLTTFMGALELQVHYTYWPCMNHIPSPTAANNVESAELGKLKLSLLHLNRLFLHPGGFDLSIRRFSADVWSFILKLSSCWTFPFPRCLLTAIGSVNFSIFKTDYESGTSIYSRPEM